MYMYMYSYHIPVGAPPTLIATRVQYSYSYQMSRLSYRSYTYYDRNHKKRIENLQ